MERSYPNLYKLITIVRFALAVSLLAPLFYLYTQPIAYVKGALFHGWIGPGVSQLYYLGSPWTPSPIIEAHVTYRLGLLGSLLGLAGLIASEARRDPALTEASGYIVVFSTAISLSVAKVPLAVIRLLEGTYVYHTNLGVLDLGRVVVETTTSLNILNIYSHLWLPLALGLALLSASTHLVAGGEPRGS